MSAATVVARPPSRRPAAPAAAGRVTARRHSTWLAAALVMAFLVPFVFADLLGMQRDLYYAVYIAFVVGLCGAWMRDTGQSLREMAGRRPRLALGLAVVFSAIAVGMVLSAEAASPHPAGLEFAAALIWRGLIYGAADGLLLTAFPILVVYAALKARPGVQARGHRLRAGALALAVSLLFTGVYHLGYPDFRGEKVVKPMAGDLIWAPSTLITANPIGGPIVHSTMHVTAVARSYETDLFLPPH